jgi:outer membrane protein TolC
MKSLLGILLFLLAGSGVAADYPDLPPAAEVVEVLERLPTVAAARAAIRLEEANRQRLEAGPHETVLRLTGQRREVRPAPGAQYGEWNVALERAFRLPGKAELDARLGEEGVEQARLALGDALHEAARSLLKSWFAWVKENVQTALWREQVALIREQLAVVERRIRAGDAPRMERLAAEAALAQAEANLAQARFREQAAATELARRFPGLRLPAEMKPVLASPPPFDAAYWRKKVLDHNHELAAAQAAARRSRLMVARAEAERLPDPTLGVHAGRERGGEENVIGLTVSIPFGGAARAATVAVHRAEAEMAAQREALVAARLALEAENLFQGAQAAHAAAVSQTAAAQAMEEAAALAARAYALGEGGLNDLLTARRLALEARLAATLATIEASEAHYRLLLDAHALWPIGADEHEAEHAPLTP